MEYPSSRKANDELRELVRTMPAHIKEHCVYKDIKAGTVFLHGGDSCETIYILTSGIVQAIDESIYGILNAFSNYSAYDIFGEMEIIGGYDTYMLSIRAITDAKIITIPRDVFLNWIKTDSRAIYVISRMLTQKLCEESNKERSRLFAPALVQMMMYFSRDFENSGDLYYCTKTRQQIADETGLSVKTINRNIKKLDEMKYLTLKKGHVNVNQPQNRLMLDYLSKWSSAG